MEAERKSVTVNGKQIEYTYLDNQGNRVCFMFSGAGYLYDKPLFYYSTMLMLEQHFDVVHIHFSYEDDIFDLSMESMTEVIVNDVNPILEEVWGNKEYEETILLGKSFGTIPMINGFMSEERFIDTSMVILTPLLKSDYVYENFLKSKIPTYLVIGTGDHHYITDRVEALEKKENIVLKKFEGADHSLDIRPFNTEKAVRLIKDTMKGMKEFVKEKSLPNK